MALDKTKVVYQIYPKSYKDTTGNGIGDFRGIIEKIPYLAELGVDMVWLNPFYPSPQRDNGYDISDYTAVNPVFGDMADFEEMVRVGKTWYLTIAQRSMSGSKKHWLVTSITKISSSFRTNQPIGYLNLVVLPGLLLEIQGNTIFTSLMKHRQTSIGVIPMFVRSCSRWSTSGVTRELEVSVSM